MVIEKFNWSEIGDIMSILLRNVDVPKSCADCIMKNYYAFLNCTRFLEMGNRIKYERHKECPLIEVKENEIIND